jgi:uncharacterized protein (TIGR03905 family)
MFEYLTRGTCSTKIRFDVRKGRVYDLVFENGCNGNLKALALLAEGMKTGDLIGKLKGLRCGQKETSCADQFARALERCETKI